jgi:hypothetical protein
MAARAKRVPLFVLGVVVGVVLAWAIFVFVLLDWQ